MKEELRTVSRMVAVGSDIIDQSRKTVSQLQVKPPSTTVLKHAILTTMCII